MHRIRKGKGGGKGFGKLNGKGYGSFRNRSIGRSFGASSSGAIAMYPSIVSASASASTSLITPPPASPPPPAPAPTAPTSTPPALLRAFALPSEPVSDEQWEDYLDERIAAVRVSKWRQDRYDDRLRQEAAQSAQSSNAQVEVVVDPAPEPESPAESPESP
jgi:hypothetical protein